MIRLISFCTIFFCTASLFAQDASSSKQQSLPDKQLIEFQQLTRRWMQAYNADDTAALRKFYAPSAQYISSHVMGLVAKGRDSVIANFHKGIKMGGHIDSISVLSYERSCEIATLVCLYTATNDGVKAEGRNVLVLKKQNGSWVIITHMTVV